MSTAIKVYDESMPGAPVLGAGAGTELAVLYACLCTGFGQRSATITVAGGVATVTTANEPKNANMVHSVILVEGVTGALSALNGEQKITAATATTLQFATTQADGTAAGTITIKTAPAGWQRVFNDDTKHVAVFTSTDVQSTGKYLWVDGSNSQYTYVRGYSNMTDVNTGTAPFPPASVADANFRWRKSYNTSDTKYGWDLFADSRAFYYSSSTYPGLKISQNTYFFGDLVSDVGNRAHNCVITSSGLTDVTWGGCSLAFSYGRQPGRCYIAKDETGAGDGVGVNLRPLSADGSSGNDNSLGEFPSAGGQLLLTKIAAVTSKFRGFLPGIYYVPQSLRYAGITGRSIQPDQHDQFVRAIITGKSYWQQENYSGENHEKMFVQVTGSWR